MNEKFRIATKHGILNIHGSDGNSVVTMKNCSLTTEDIQTYNRMNIADMRTFRRMSRVTREDELGNEYIRGSLDMASIADKMRQHRLRWLGHVTEREEFESVRIEVKRKAMKGRPKK
ncbi:Hypothetical protein CINCED_3A025285 [Cinara cedri]|uniref:Uncharacterized protein n=1 Tax=Cinara cedri TaxID=506608 RepID=A0A5E4NDF3_9HEMI|nr:Hypothetical protein CINCED_3A025285 [Cinara cedri]